MHPRENDPFPDTIVYLLYIRLGTMFLFNLYLFLNRLKILNIPHLEAADTQITREPLG